RKNARAAPRSPATRSRLPARAARSIGSVACTASATGRRPKEGARSNIRSSECIPHRSARSLFGLLPISHHPIERNSKHLFCWMVGKHLHVALNTAKFAFVLGTKDEFIFFSIFDR